LLNPLFDILYTLGILDKMCTSKAYLTNFVGSCCLFYPLFDILVMLGILDKVCASKGYLHQP